MTEAIFPPKQRSFASEQVSCVQSRSAEAIPLCALQPGQWADISWIAESHPFARRLRDLGFSPGTRLHVRLKAPMRGPIEYEIRGSRFCLRLQDTQDIYVIPVVPVIPIIPATVSG